MISKAKLETSFHSSIADPYEAKFQDHLRSLSVADVIKTDERIQNREAFLKEMLQKFDITSNAVDRGLMHFIVRGRRKMYRLVGFGSKRSTPENRFDPIFFVLDLAQVKLIQFFFFWILIKSS